MILLIAKLIILLIVQHKRKDIHPELMLFLEDSLDDIPQNNNIDICFYLSEETKSESKENVIIKWFITYFSFYVEIEKAKLRKIYRNSFIYFLIASLLLTSSYFAVYFRENVFLHTISEIIIVGGWVLLWESVSLLLFERKKLRRLIKDYRRIVSANVFFKYRKKIE